MSKIFISYRAEDTEGFAVQVSDQLRMRFGEGATHSEGDHANGDQAPAYKIESEIRDCKVVIAVIGPKWLSASDDKGHPRLENPDDTVRLQISAAFKGHKKVIPLLSKGARMPDADSLPSEIASLSKLQPVELTDVDTFKNLEPLIAKLEPFVEEPAADSGPRVEELAPAVQPVVTDGGRPADEGREAPADEAPLEQPSPKVANPPLRLPDWLTKRLWFWPRIFISYRRADSQDPSLLIAEHLRKHYGRRAVFIDSELAEGGQWSEDLKSEIAACNTFLAVIGADWAGIRENTEKRRINDPDDVVAKEIEQALVRYDAGQAKDLDGTGEPTAHDEAREAKHPKSSPIEVIPVLLDGTEMPKAEELPESLQGLPKHNAAHVRSGKLLERDVIALRNSIDKYQGRLWKLWTKRSRVISVVFLGSFLSFAVWTARLIGSILIPHNIEVVAKFPDEIAPGEYRTAVFRTNTDGQEYWKVDATPDSRKETAWNIPVGVKDKSENWAQTSIWAVAIRRGGPVPCLEGSTRVGLRDLRNSVEVPLRECDEIIVRLTPPKNEDVTIDDSKVEVFKNRWNYQNERFVKAPADRIDDDEDDEGPRQKARWRLRVMWQDKAGRPKTRIHARAPNAILTNPSCPKLLGYVEILDLLNPEPELWIDLKCVANKTSD